MLVSGNMTAQGEDKVKKWDKLGILGLVAAGLFGGSTASYCTSPYNWIVFALGVCWVLSWWMRAKELVKTE